jgi:hypothetical protein
LTVIDDPILDCWVPSNASSVVTEFPAIPRRLSGSGNPDLREQAFNSSRYCHHTLLRNKLGHFQISKAGGSVMDTQATARIGLDELDQIIDRLYGRLLIQRARLRLSADASIDREDDERIIKNIQTALHKLRALRDAMRAEKPPTKYLH